MRILAALAVTAALAGSAMGEAWAQGAPAAGTAQGTNAALAPIELQGLSATRTDEGVMLGFGVRITPTRVVEEALLRGVPVHFVAEAELMRQRWYWTDKRVARASRTWRVAWQPLTRSWSVSFGGLQQRYDTLAEALAAIGRVGSWKIAEPLAADDDDRYVIEFSYRLDTSQLPRPLQIGFGGPSEWDIGVQRSFGLGAPR